MSLILLICICFLSLQKIKNTEYEKSIFDNRFFVQCNICFWTRDSGGG